MTKDSLTRRQVLHRSLYGSAVVLLASTATADNQVRENEPRAVALGYQRNGDKVDTQRFPKKTRGTANGPQACENCAQFGPEKTCRLFDDRRVSANGWCNGWTPR
jgi:hypothetical protein